MRAWSRGFRVLIAFGFRAAPLQATLFLCFGALMALSGPATSVGAKLLVDAAASGRFRDGVIAAIILALTAGIGLIVVLYYVDFLFTVVERAGGVADKRLMELMGGVVGIAHHERPDYLDQLQLLREDRARLAWMTNATAGLVRVAVQLAASAVLLGRLQPVLLLLPVFGVVSFVAGKRAQDIQLQARESTTEPERLRKQLFSIATTASAGKELRVFDLTGEIRRRHHLVSGAVIQARNRADWQSAGFHAVDAVVFGVAYAGAIGLVLVRAVRGEATPGDVVLTVGLAAGMNGIVSTAVGYGTHFLAVLKVARRYLWLEDYAQSVRVPLPDPAPTPERLASGIELRDVSFRYPGTDRPILSSVSLRLPAGGRRCVGGRKRRRQDQPHQAALPVL